MKECLVKFEDLKEQENKREYLLNILKEAGFDLQAEIKKEHSEIDNSYIYYQDGD